MSETNPASLPADVRQKLIAPHPTEAMETMKPETSTPEGSASACSGDYVGVARDLARIADGSLRHRYAGACPDEIEGHASRDPLCAACKILRRFEALESIERIAIQPPTTGLRST